MRKKLISGNWKMYKTLPEALKLAGALVERLSDVNDVEIAIAPNFTVLHPVSEVLKGSRIKLSAQNIYHEKDGPYTGETSADMIKAAGAEMVIVGHSERRKYFQETDDSLSKKIDAALKNDLVPIFCVGENLDERNEGRAETIVEGQIVGGLEGIGIDRLKDVVIAYEPVWAIGTGVNATPDQAQEMHEFIRKLIENKFHKNIAKDLKILYGGSVKPDNVDGLIAKPDIDGALVGGASLDVDSFERIVRFNR